MTPSQREAVVGITIVIILLVPLMFQVFILRHEQKKRHLEILERLKSVEEKLSP